MSTDKNPTSVFTGVGFSIYCSVFSLLALVRVRSPLSPVCALGSVSPRRRCTTLEGAALRGKGFSLARRFLCGAMRRIFSPSVGSRRQLPRQREPRGASFSSGTRRKICGTAQRPSPTIMVWVHRNSLKTARRTAIFAATRCPF